MTAEEFAVQFSKLIPSRTALLKAFESAEIVDEFIAANTLARRSAPLKISPESGSEELIKLFNGWSLKGLTIGMIEFADKPVETPTRWKKWAESSR